MTDQEIKDQEYFEKYGIKYHRNLKHETCPFCGGHCVTVNDGHGDVLEEVRFQMVCEDCDKVYQAVYAFSYCVTVK